ncbi:hypothetical protein GX50_06652 [[Emmonsia] crescens]|uniref:Uncharacterized protein n=1 Tax=[Emmonsia] crescens TaxID=73230 RepID=A0A2B7ZBJ0_9EURO|nr:hypothetical protein GX50_06652 [Emmonsia crescens]
MDASPLCWSVAFMHVILNNIRQMLGSTDMPQLMSQPSWTFTSHLGRLCVETTLKMYPDLGASQASRIPTGDHDEWLRR